MKRERYIVAIMSSSGRHMRTFSIPASCLILISICLAIAVTLSFTYASLAVRKYCEKQRHVAVDAVQRYEFLREEIQEIRKSYSDFKSILGIETDKPSDEMGRGGPKMPELTDVSIAELFSAGEMADDAGMAPSSALIEAISLRSDIKTLTRSAGARMAELARIPSIWPIAVEPGTRPPITSRFGMRRSPFTGEWETHGGIDIASAFDTPIIATAEGTIVDIGKDRYLGNFVEIRHSEKFSTLYGHMSHFAEGMKKGTRVNRRDVIGYIGMTGRATWYHIHYEVKVYGDRVNPADYILN